PDGDTGTNMALTLESVVAEVGDTADMAGICKAISHGSLMGARGNSGVILSQILRGIADGFKNVDTAGPLDVAAALSAASEGAYRAVMKPVEGTILTVVRAAASGAEEAADAGKALIDVLDGARVAAADALARTPDLLPVLAQAGVVDAGGAGFCLLLDVLLHVVSGRPVPEPAPITASVAARFGASADPALAAVHEDVSDLRYEVMYLLEAPDDTIGAFRDVWAGIGDSIVVVGGEGLWNCHIHTDDIGASIEAALDCGRPRHIRITDLLEQVQEERWVREAEADPVSGDNAAPVTTAVVAIATGAGLGRLFRSVGVQSIVAGGQSMNPSTAQLLQAVEASPAEQVVILPNNKNIIPVAEQVDSLTGKHVVVVGTRSISEGLAAAFAYDPEGDAETNAEAMYSAAGGVVAGEVTRAVRDSVCDAGPIAEGDYLGLSREGIVVVAPTLAGAACGLLDQLMTDDHEIVTVLEGEGSAAAATREITEWLAEKRPGAVAEVHHGGQPLYPYLFSIE
ncbi:MAG TPA: DAK2 domain-containing protein, partial [Acidimicrobiales bacterium]|nr:DAK2 domain-containing protein [Acidimicrobiales bacterium]